MITTLVQPMVVLNRVVYSIPRLQIPAVERAMVWFVRKIIVLPELPCILLLQPMIATLVQPMVVLNRAVYSILRLQVPAVERAMAWLVLKIIVLLELPCI